MIDPVSMPSAAAINYGENDVRHFSEGDSLDVPGLSTSSRHLAQRDVALASKLNEVIGEVNNHEQFVPLPVVRTILPPNAEEIVVNYRIPPGFEARVLNAIITSIPPSASAELDVYYAQGYGNSTGTTIVSTSTEFTSGTEFYSQGEFIVTLKNRGGATLEMIASLILTMRPVTERQGVLIPSVPPAVQGPPGPQGPVGAAGGTGPAGAAGTPGLTWKGVWNGGALAGGTGSPTTYTDTDVVYWKGSSYKSQHPGNTGNQPPDPRATTPDTSHWNFLAIEGAPGFNWQGLYSDIHTGGYAVNDVVEQNGSSYVCVVPAPMGQDPEHYPTNWQLVAQKGQDGFNYRGPYDGSGYKENDVVSVTIPGTGMVQTYVANTDVAVGAPSPPNSSWDVLFSNVTPTYTSVSSATGSYAAGTTFAVASGNDGNYLQVSPPVTFPCSIILIKDPTVNHGVAFLYFQQYIRWGGQILINLPVPSGSTDPNPIVWAANMVTLSAVMKGPVDDVVAGPAAQFVGVSISQTASQFAITAPGPDCSVYIAAVGMTVF
jgi:hypothetical protein